MKQAFIKRIAQTALGLLVFIASANGQSKVDIATTDLYNQIKMQDSLLFAAFNTRDVETFKKYFSDDLEFYHDKGGVSGYEETINFLKTTAQQNNGLKRELVEGTLEVYPVPGYGAMEIGSHRFCHVENGKEDCGSFKFIHIWHQKNGQWKITRVISYDH